MALQNKYVILVLLILLSACIIGTASAKTWTDTGLGYQTATESGYAFYKFTYAGSYSFSLPAGITNIELIGGGGPGGDYAVMNISGSYGVPA